MSLEIIIPAHNPGAELAKTVESLTTQTNREFTLLLGDNFSRTGINHLDAAQKKLSAAGIIVRRVKPPFELKRIEFWNWLHAQSSAAWLKLIFPGDQLKPAYVEQLKRRLAGRTNAHLVRCDAEVKTDWGMEKVAAPFERDAITRAEFTNFFPAHLDWLAHPLNFAYSRTAWLALGGFATQLPGCAALNLHVSLALHHGLENLAEPLAATELAHQHSLNENDGGWVNHSLELWLVLRQAKNYCLANKLPWPRQWPFIREITAALGRW